jgi:hypothetical protein
MAPGFQQEEDRNVLLAAINGDQAFQDLLFKSFPPDILDSVSGAGENSFNASSKKIVLIDDWNGSSDGTSGSNPLVALRLRADATAKELKKDTGIDLSQANTPATGAAVRADNTLLESIARDQAKALCLVSTETGDGKVRAITERTRERQLGIGVNRIVLLQNANGTRSIEANLDASPFLIDARSRYLRLATGTPLALDEAISMFYDVVAAVPPSRRLFAAYPLKQPSYYEVFALNIPIVTAEGQKDLGTQLRSYIYPGFDFPFSRLSPTLTTPTIAPTERSNVLSLSISDERNSKSYLLLCTTSF